MDNTTIIALLGLMITLVGGVWVCVIKHLGNGNHHPSKKDIVYKDVCSSERQRIEDCIENAMSLQSERLKTLTEKLEETKTILSANIEHLAEAVDNLVDGEFNRGK